MTSAAEIPDRLRGTKPNIRRSGRLDRYSPSRSAVVARRASAPSAIVGKRVAAGLVRPELWFASTILSFNVVE